MPVHFANGAEAAAKLRAAGIADLMDGDDVLVDGPLPGGLASPGDWAERAAWMARHYGADPSDYAGRAARRLAALQQPHDALVHWADDGCLHCAANLLHLLAQPAAAPRHLALPQGRRVTDLPPAELAALRPAPLAPKHLDAARQAWAWLAAAPAARGPPPRTGWAWADEALALRAGMEAALDEVFAAHAGASFPAVFGAVQQDSRTRRLGLGDATVRRLWERGAVRPRQYP